MYFYKSVMFLLLLMNFFACGDSITENSENPNENESQINLNSENANIDSHLTSDILGGIFIKNTNTIQSSELNTIYEDKSSMYASKTSISPEIKKEKSENKEERPFAIDSSFQFLGLNGIGRLTLSASGKGEESKTDKGYVLRKFSPLVFRFVFFNFASFNPCLGLIHLEGEIHCDIQGDYILDTQKFVGTAHCIHGPKNNPQTILYVTDEKTYNVELDANLLVNGSPFNHSSYIQEGKIVIDGVSHKIEDIMKNPLSCQ